MKVSYQKAAAIEKKYGYGDKITDLKNGRRSELLLNTGARIVRRDDAYHVQGYAYDNSDVEAVM